MGESMDRLENFEKAFINERGGKKNENSNSL